MAAATTTLELLDGIDRLDQRIGDDALDAARILAEDFLAIAVAGAATPAGRVIHDYAADARPGRATLAASGATTDAATAALVNGTSGYAIGLTDTHARSITHPGPSIVPAALAAGQETGADGEQLLRAIVAGVEAVVRIGSVVNPSHRARGYHPTATCNVFGAVVAVGRLHSLDREQIANAMGIAGSMTGGLYEFRHEGSMLMAFHGGWPAHNGVVAVELARRGFTGPTTVLEGPEGFFRAFADDIHPELLAVDPAHPGILEVGLRPYNACRYGHSGIDALIEIAAQRGPIDPAEIERVTVETHRTAVDQETEPDTVIGARLSTKFTIAYAIAHGAKITEVDEADLADPLVRQIVDRMDVVEAPDLTAIFPAKWSCRVTVAFRDGTSATAQVDVPKGEPENPMTEAELSAKFHRLTEPVLGADGAAALERKFLGLAGAGSLDGLGAALGRLRAADDPTTRV
jgi:2-methylcitrate dehydratase PrpD